MRRDLIVGGIGTVIGGATVAFGCLYGGSAVLAVIAVLAFTAGFTASAH